MSIVRSLRLACFGVVACVAAPAHASAAVVATRCNACSPAQYYTVGVNWARTHNMARGYVFVYDVPAGQMKKYDVEREPAANGTWLYTLTEVALTSDQASAWAQAKSILQSNGGSTLFATVDTRTNPSLPARDATAYQIALTSAYRNDIDAYLMNGSNNIVLNNAVLTMNAIFNIASVFLLEQDIWVITVTWITIDGGKIDFQWRAGYNHSTITRMIDGDGNTIAVDEDDIVGQYRLGTGREPHFRDYMQGRFGDDVIFGPNICNNGIMACTRAAGAYRCQWFTCGGVGH